MQVLVSHDNFSSLVYLHSRSKNTKAKTSEGTILVPRLICLLIYIWAYKLEARGREEVGVPSEAAGCEGGCGEVLWVDATSTRVECKEEARCRCISCRGGSPKEMRGTVVIVKRLPDDNRPWARTGVKSSKTSGAGRCWEVYRVSHNTRTSAARKRASIAKSTTVIPKPRYILQSCWRLFGGGGFSCTWSIVALTLGISNLQICVKVAPRRIKQSHALHSRYFRGNSAGFARDALSNPYNQNAPVDKLKKLWITSILVRSGSRYGWVTYHNHLEPEGGGQQCVGVVVPRHPNTQREYASG